MIGWCLLTTHIKLIFFKCITIVQTKP